MCVCVWVGVRGEGGVKQGINTCVSVCGWV